MTLNAIVVLAIMLLPLTSKAEQLTPIQERSPLVVFTTVEFGGHFRNREIRIKAHPVSFAAYTDGTVIYEDSKDKRTGYSSVRLSPSTLQGFLSRIGLDSVSQLDDSYYMSRIHHPPVYDFYLWSGGQRKTVKVIGSFNPEHEEHALIPTSLVEIFNYAEELRLEPLRPWAPEEVEVLLKPIDGSSLRSIPWPAEWAKFKRRLKPEACSFPYCRASSGALRATAYTAFVMLPGKEFNRLRTLVRRVDDTERFVLIDGQVWSVSYYIPFPNERKWLD